MSLECSSVACWNFLGHVPTDTDLCKGCTAPWEQAWDKFSLIDLHLGTTLQRDGAVQGAHISLYANAGILVCLNSFSEVGKGFYPSSGSERLDTIWTVSALPQQKH